MTSQRLPVGARVAVIGAGPSGLVAGKHALEAGFDVTVFEASDDLGGQWHTSADHSGVWPGMATNTSRAMTAFSDFPHPPDFPLHPQATQIHDYLRAYAVWSGVLPRVRFDTAVSRLTREGGSWRVDGEPFEGVVMASGRFRRPRLPGGLTSFHGEVLHAFDYLGAPAYDGRAVLVLGNGISGLEIASDLATVASVVSAFRKPRYVIQKVVDGVSSDWQWYTSFLAEQRRRLPREQFALWLRDRVVRVAGHPADFGAPAPDDDLLVAGISLCQGYLRQVADGDIRCRPGLADVGAHEVTFTDGSTERVEVIVCATGYDLDVPYLAPDVRRVLGGELSLYHRTIHPDLPGLGVVGLWVAQGPYFPVLELQARWVTALWAGDAGAPDSDRQRAQLTPCPPLDPHHMLATTLAQELGVAPDLNARPELADALVFGPMLPPRYRLDGPGAQPDAQARFTEQLAASPCATVTDDDRGLARSLGLPI